MFKYSWVWKKPQGVDPFMAKVRPLNDIEDVVVFCKGRTIYNPQLTAGKPYTMTRDKRPRTNQITGTAMRETTTVNGGFRLPTRLLEFKQERGHHPTQKPVALMEYLIKTYTDQGDLVLDNVAGSGTTGIAAMNTNRNFILMEQEPEYVEIIKQRLELNKERLTKLEENDG